ncbi:MAG: alpha/beta fold hydrolase, partial [Pseudomonadota bacterium]
MHLVLLPGMMCDARLFAPQTAALSGRVSLHFPTMATRNTVAGLAAEVLAGAPPRFALLGLSMGGIIAMVVVRQAPERVSHLALLDTNPLAEHADVRVRRVSQMAAVRTGQLDTVMREEMKPNYLASGEGRTAILDLCLDMALGLGPDAFIRQSEALMARP